MNEPIFLAFFIWALVYLDEFVRGCFPSPDSDVAPARMKPNRALEACGIALAGGAFTRYDGWFVAAVVGSHRRRGSLAAWWQRNADRGQRRAMAKSLAEFLLLNALVPVFWLIYTYCISGYALDFANGPYSAKAIALRSTGRGTYTYPGQHDLFTAALYFLKSAKLNLGAEFWGQILFATAVGGNSCRDLEISQVRDSICCSGSRSRSTRFPSLTAACPSTARLVSVLVLQRALRSGTAPGVCGVHFLLACVHRRARQRGCIKECGLVCADRGYGRPATCRPIATSPITLREALVNSRGRVAIERALATYLGELPRSATLLMYTARSCGRAAIGRSSTASRDLRIGASRLGVGAARSGPSC